MSDDIRVFIVFLVVTIVLACGIGIVFKRAADQALVKRIAVEQTLGEHK